MGKLKPCGEEKIVFEGQILEIVKQPMSDGKRNLEYEFARRSPGVRLLIVKNDKILLTKEFRVEISEEDFRLPGGKVFDTLPEYKKALNKDIIPFATEAAKKECLEETGLIANNLKFLYKATTGGSTVRWDLYYFVVNDFSESPDGQNLELGEDIQVEWKTFEEAKQLCLQNHVKEDRSVSVLLKFILGREK